MRHHVGALLVFSGLWMSPAPASAQVPAGAELQVNTHATGSQYEPAVTSDPAGRFVVAWSSSPQDGSGSGVFARRYDANGTPRGGEFRVNDYTTGNQWRPAITSDAGGGFVVVWQSVQDGGGDGVFAQRYDAQGSRRGGEFQVNTFTTGDQEYPAVASDAAGNFVVAWTSADQEGSGPGVFAQRYDASGAARGSEFQVNTYTRHAQAAVALASAPSGDFVVVWSSYGQDGSSWGVFAQRYNASGAPRGAELQVNSYTTLSQYRPSVRARGADDFVVTWMSEGQDGSGWGVVTESVFAPIGVEYQVNSYTTGDQLRPSLALDAAGSLVVAWQSAGQDGSGYGVFAQRYQGGTPRGPEFQVNSHTSGYEWRPAIASDAVGNLVVAWESLGQDGDAGGIYAQRLGGLLPASLAVDASASAGSDGNGMLEPGESVTVAPSWRNVNGEAQTLDGSGLYFHCVPVPGAACVLQDPAASYGTVADGATAQCSDCYQVGVTFGGIRPSTHWDPTFTERLLPDAMGQTKPWSVHVGESFTDVPKTSPYYRFVETLLHRGVTGGCSLDSYCPASAVTREQMAVFVLIAKEGAGYLPPACSTPIFGDVPATSPSCRYVEELARRGVVSGCGGGNYCPAAAVTREQMSVFLLHTLDPALNPPACAAPAFDDVPVSSPFCRWIAELLRRGITAGCGGGNYCPAAAVTREQMAVFVGATFALSLYGP